MSTRLLPRRGAARPVLLVSFLLLSLVALAGLIAWKLPWLKSLLRSDADNAVEARQLKEASLKVVETADPGTGWPQWLGPFRDGRAPVGPLRTDWDKTPPVKVWEASCGGGFGSLAVVDGKLYLHDRNGGSPEAAIERLRCLEAASGKPIWEHSSTSDYTKMDRAYANGPRATPTVENDRIYTVGAGGLFLCVRAPLEPGDKPQELWRHDLLKEFDAKSPQWGVACSPLIEGNLVIVQPGDASGGSVAAFDKLSGELRWKAGRSPSGYSSPIAATIAGKRVILAMTGNSLLCLSTDGAVLGYYKWETDFDGNIATPIAVGDYIFISSGYNHGCALLRGVRDGAADALRLEQVYVRSNKVMRNHHATSLYKDGYLYGFDNTELKCVDFRTLREKEGWESERLGKGSMILAGKTLVILTEAGELALVEATPEEFRILARMHSGLNGRSEIWALPVLVDGRLYLRDQEKILCWDVK